MSSIITKENIRNCLSTVFYIPPKENCNYVNIDSIQTTNQLNQVDFKTNYFAFIRKKTVGQNNISPVFCYTDNSTLMNYYLLEILRIPVKQYTNNDEIVKEINKSYSMSIYNCLLNDYIISTILNTGKDIFNIYSEIQYQTFYDTLNKYNIDIEGGADIYRNKKLIKMLATNYVVDIEGINRLLKIEENNNLHISYDNTKFGNNLFTLYYKFDTYSIYVNDETKQNKINNFLKDNKIYVFVSHYDTYNNYYSFYLYSEPKNKTYENDVTTIRPFKEGDHDSYEQIDENTYIQITVYDDITTIKKHHFESTPMEENETPYYHSEIKTTRNDNEYIVETIKYAYSGDSIRISFNIDNDYIDISDIYKYDNITYSNTYTNIDNFSFDNNYNVNFNSIKTVEFINKTIIQQLSIIRNYTGDSIEYDFDLLPVDVVFSAISNINSPHNDYEKSLEYNCIVKKQQLYCKDNKIYSLSNNLLITDNIGIDSFYSTFNANAFNVMNYLQIPENKINVSTQNLFSINNKFVNVIQGNFITAYIYNSDKIFNYHANDYVYFDDLNITNKFEIHQHLPFPETEKINICYSYNKNIDMILNNNDINNNIVFNIINTVDYDKNNNIINVKKNVKLSNSGVYIYLTGTQFFQWLFTTNVGMIKFNYIN